MCIYKGIYIYYMYTFQFSSWLTTARSDKQEQEKLRKQDRICKQDRKKGTTLHLLPELSPWRGWRKLLKPCREHPESWSLDCLCLGSRFAWSVFSAPKVLSRSWQGIFGFPSKECIVLGRTIKLQDIDRFSSLPVGKKPPAKVQGPVSCSFSEIFPSKEFSCTVSTAKCCKCFSEYGSEPVNWLACLCVTRKKWGTKSLKQARKILLDTALPQSWSLDYLS